MANRYGYFVAETCSVVDAVPPVVYVDNVEEYSYGRPGPLNM